MKILVVAPDTLYSGEQVCRALREEGHHVRWINQRGLSKFPLLWKVIRHIRPLRIARNFIIGRWIISSAHSLEVELVLICKGTTIKKETLRRLRGMGAILVNWFPENTMNEPYWTWINQNAGEYDLFSSFDSSLLREQHRFPNTKLKWLPMAVNPELFHVESLSKEDREKYSCDICFVGAYYPEREELLARLVTRYRIKIFGWHGWENTSLSSWYHGPLSAHESAKAYRCAAISLNLNTHPPVAGVNAKTFEICAAGGFQLTDFRTDLSKLFDEDREVVAFRTPKELDDKVRYYLSDKSARSAIARAGQLRVLRDHTMRKRVEMMIRMVIKTNLPL